MAQIKSIQVKRSDADNLRRRLHDGAVVAGVPASSNPYPDGTSVVEVAADHEFGSDMPRTYKSSRGNTVFVSGVPERSFLRSTAKENRSKWKADAVAAIKRVVAGKSNSDRATAQLGSIMSSAIKAKIVEISDPPNSPQVIAEKGSSNPLIDTGHLLESITYDVRDE